MGCHNEMAYHSEMTTMARPNRPRIIISLSNYYKAHDETPPYIPVPNLEPTTETAHAFQAKLTSRPPRSLFPSTVIVQA